MKPARGIGIACCVLLAAASAGTASARQAAATPGSIDGYLARIDRDGDGRVSLEEYLAWMSHGFERMDRNRDGVLQPHEQPGGRGRALSRVEHRAALEATFRRQDVNRDGYLDARELAAPPR
ncbi:hypothetical protein [Luteimonas sp. e5]